MLKLGSRDPLQVRQVVMNWGADIRLLYASDLHLTHWTSQIVEQLHLVCQMHAPDLIVLGGDLVDLPNGIPLLSEFIRSCACPLWAVAGNHDVLVGLDRVRSTVEASGGQWLDKAIRLHNNLQLDGICQPTGETNTVLCAHDPSIFPRAVSSGYRLVLAGHLHGGQCVLHRGRERSYPGAFLSRWNGDCFKCGQATMLVSRGVNDTLPIRWNCPREVILCSF